MGHYRGFWVVTFVLMWCKSEHLVDASAQEILENIKHEFDMNVNFQLRKLGLRQGAVSKSSNLFIHAVFCACCNSAHKCKKKCRWKYY